MTSLSPVFERIGRERMAGDRRLEHLLGLGEALDVVDVGVRGDQRHALREREVELPDDLEALVDRVFVADVDQRPTAVVVVNQIDRAADPPPGLVVQLDDVGEDGLTLEHGGEAGRRAAANSRKMTAPIIRLAVAVSNRRDNSGVLRLAAAHACR